MEEWKMRSEKILSKALKTPWKNGGMEEDLKSVILHFAILKICQIILEDWRNGGMEEDIRNLSLNTLQF